ncbi:MAG: ABC transporter ATP-binding protein [Candidatus Eremiobacteraeota bacterium]|nr:ABC transporter ATP-binding protein [Candidatus Eremiobacteraeota bacterium]
MEAHRVQLHGTLTVPALEARELYRFYHVGDEETLALRGVSLQVGSGEVVAIVGPSGSGKSTLLACLAGLDEPDGGYVAVAGQRITRRPESVRARLRAKHIGMLMQSENLLTTLSVADNVRLQLSLAGTTDPRLLENALQQADIAHRAKAKPGQLSGGEVSRAALAVALATNPELLLADEPTGEVDAETEQKILRVLDERRKSGGATVVATHSEALMQWAGRTIGLLDGRIVE